MLHNAAAKTTSASAVAEQPASAVHGLDSTGSPTDPPTAVVEELPPADATNAFDSDNATPCEPECDDGELEPEIVADLDPRGPPPPPSDDGVEGELSEALPMRRRMRTKRPNILGAFSVPEGNLLTNRGLKAANGGSRKSANRLPRTPRPNAR